MTQYINKSALVAEIERRATFFLNESKKKTTLDDSSCAVALYGLFSFLDTLEVKEVDLEKEYAKYYEQERNIQTFKLAKHFFELGLKAQKVE